MNPARMAARIALVAGVLDRAGVRPISLYCHHLGQVDIMVARADYAAAVERLGLDPVDHLDGNVATGTWADIRIWCQRFDREVAAS